MSDDWELKSEIAFQKWKKEKISNSNNRRKNLRWYNKWLHPGPSFLDGDCESHKTVFKLAYMQGVVDFLTEHNNRLRWGENE